MRFYEERGARRCYEEIGGVEERKKGRKGKKGGGKQEEGKKGISWDIKEEKQGTAGEKGKGKKERERREGRDGMSKEGKTGSPDFGDTGKVQKNRPPPCLLPGGAKNGTRQTGDFPEIVPYGQDP